MKQECCEKCRVRVGGSGGGFPTCYDFNCPCHQEQKELSKCCGAEKVVAISPVDGESYFMCKKCQFPFIPQEQKQEEREHICSGNCRRVGCNCECGEFHEVKKQ